LGEGFAALAEYADPERVDLLGGLAGEAQTGEEALDGAGEGAGGGGLRFGLGGEVARADLGMGVEEACQIAAWY
jgi:hypothetical protein